MATDVSAAIKGGSWLVSETAETFTPERLSDDHRMIAQTAHEFMTNEVVPVIDKLETKDWTLARAMRIHRNATATVVPFLFLALIYVLLGAPANVAWGLFGTFTVARVLHSIVYAMGVQPWRTVLYSLSQLAILGLTIQIVRAIV